MLTLLMWREVQPMGFVTNYCLHPGLQALLAFLSKQERFCPPCFLGFRVGWWQPLFELGQEIEYAVGA